MHVEQNSQIQSSSVFWVLIIALDFINSANVIAQLDTST